jgi:predicted dehydrogenase
MPKTLGVGIVGAGSISDMHAPGYNEKSNSKIIAYTDVNAELAAVKSKKFGAETSYSSVDQLLKDDRVEVVDVCIPTAFHSKVAIQAIEAGKHVFLEKPMAFNVKECDDIIAAAKKAGVKLMVNHDLIFFPPFAFCKKLITDGGVGRLVRMRATQMAGHRYMGWRADPSITGGGLLIEGLVHPLYLSRWFLGELEEVSAMTGKTDDLTKAEDVVTILLRSKDAWGTVDANLNGPPPLWDDHLELIGTKGMLIANGAETQIIRGPPLMHYHDGMWTMYRDRTYESWPFPNEIEWNWPKAFVYAIGEFLSSIAENREPKVTGADGRRLIQIVEACYESANTGRRIKVS